MPRNPGHRVALLERLWYRLSPNMDTYIGPSNPGGTVWPGDTGNITWAWIDANRIQDMISLSGNTYGIAISGRTSGIIRARVIDRNFEASDGDTEPHCRTI